MKPRRSGAIVITASTNSFDGEARLSAYNATKAGLLGLLHTAANELGPVGDSRQRRLPRLHPHAPHRALLRHPRRDPGILPPDSPRPRRGAIRSGRRRRVPGLPLASFITGTTLFVDGGQMAAKFATWDETPRGVSRGPVEVARTVRPWHRDLDRYQWRVFVVATLAWLFSTMVQRLFVLARGPALRALLPPEATAADVTWYSGVATAIFMVGWAAGGLWFGVVADRWGRVKTMLLTIAHVLRLHRAFGAVAGMVGFRRLPAAGGAGRGRRVRRRRGAGGRSPAGPRAAPRAGDAASLFRRRQYPGLGRQLRRAAHQLALAVRRWASLPLALVAVSFGTLHEPESWVRLKAAGGAARRMGSLGDLFRIPRWRRHTIVGLVLAVSGVIGLWGIGFWTPELIREALAAGFARNPQPLRQHRHHVAGRGRVLRPLRLHEAHRPHGTPARLRPGLPAGTRRDRAHLRLPQPPLGHLLDDPAPRLLQPDGLRRLFDLLPGTLPHAPAQLRRGVLL